MSVRLQVFTVGVVLMGVLRRVNDRLVIFANWGVIFFIGLIAVVIPYEVFGRYVLNNMSTWSGEVATFSLVWATMMGAAAGLRKGYQVGMTFVLEKVPAPLAKGLQLVGFLFMFLFLATMVYFGSDQAMLNYYQTSPGLEIPMAFPYAALPLGFFIMFSLTVEEFLVFLGLAAAREESGPC